MDYYLDYDPTDVESCANAIQSLRSHRHNVFQDYCTKLLRSVAPNIESGDVDINEWAIRNGLPLTQKYNKTPDICFRISNNVYIGDVAVTKKFRNTNITKSQKYEGLRLMIAKEHPDIIVQELNFILEEDLSNEVDINKRLKQLFMIVVPARDSLRLREDISICNDRMEQISRDCVNPEELSIALIRDAKSTRDNLADEAIIDDQPEIKTNYVPDIEERDLFLDAWADACGTRRQAGADVQNRESGLVKMSEYQGIDTIIPRLNQINDSSFEDRAPKAALQYVFNLDADEKVNGIPLLREWAVDIALKCRSSLDKKDRFLSALPVSNQLDKMTNIDIDYKNRKKILKKDSESEAFRATIKSKYGQLLPYWSPGIEMMCSEKSENSILREYTQLASKRSEKRAPKSIHSHNHRKCITDTKTVIEYLSGETESNSTASNLSFDVPIGMRGVRETRNVRFVKPFYDRINKSRAGLLTSSIVKWIGDVSRVALAGRSGIYYSMPVQGSMIFCTLTGNYMFSSDPHYPYFTMARMKKQGTNIEEKRSRWLSMFSGRVRETIETDEYYYVMSILEKTSLSKLEKINTVDREFRTHAVSMCTLFSESVCLTEQKMFTPIMEEVSSKADVQHYIDSVKKSNDFEKDMYKMEDYLKKYIGSSALVLLDLHQKPSIILDLLKYLSGINFSEWSSLDDLFMDKLNIMLKTSLDVFLRDSVVDYCRRNIQLAKYCKPARILKSAKGILPSSFNVHGVFSSFWDDNLYTDSLMFYYSEAQLIFQARPKKLYSSQFIVKAAKKVLDNNRKMREEEVMKPGSTTAGYHSKYDFDFSSKFGYSKSAIYYAQQLMNKDYVLKSGSYKNKIYGKINSFAIENVSMRGSCKLEETIIEENTNPKNDRVNLGKSQTALYSCLEYLKNVIDSDDSDKARLFNVVKGASERRQAFNMSEKEQKGDGRPIGSPDYPSKQELYMNESIFKILSVDQNENLLVKGVNRSAKIASINREVVTSAYSQYPVKYKYIRHIVMDQSQFSEGDNCNKFCDFIEFNSAIPAKLKSTMIRTEKKHMARVQYWPNVPIGMEEEYGDDAQPFKGTRGYAGWVQGMKNIIATYTHIAAVKWIIKSFNDNYFKLPENANKYGDHKGIIAKQIVNSDDSYIIVAFVEEKPIVDFYKYMVSAKKYFRLEQNKKKSYMTATIGEIIQKYVANGTVVNIWAKAAVSSFKNNMGVDMFRDISNSIAQLGNLLREGAPETICCYVRAELKNQIYRYYNIGQTKFNDLSQIGLDNGYLPCELGGWPKYLTTYELCVAGLQSQLQLCKSAYQSARMRGEPMLEEKLVKTSIMLNLRRIKDREVWAGILTKVKDGSLDVSKIDLNKESATSELVAAKLYIYTASHDKKYSGEEINELQRQVDELGASPSLNSWLIDEMGISNSGVSSYDASFTRTIISCVSWVINIPRKVTKTVELVKQYKTLEGTGLAGLFKERASIRIAVADLVDQANMMIMELSETNFTRSIRQKALANSRAALQRCCTIGGMPYKLSILGMYNALIKLHDNMSSVYGQTLSDEFMSRLMDDPTHRSQMAYDIVQNYETTGIVPSSGYIANKLPKSEDDISLDNDIQSVLVEIVAPGYIESQGYKFRYPERLASDIAVITNIYRDWFEISKEMKLTARTIYYHNLNIRRARYIIAPPIKDKNQFDALISIYEKCQMISTNLTGFIKRSQDSTSNMTESAAKARSNVHSLIGAMEVALYMKKYESLPYEDTLSNIKFNGSPILDFIESDDYRALFKTADPYLAPYLATLSLMAGDYQYMTMVSERSEYHINWDTPQKHQVDGDRKIYHGYFEVTISKGDDAVKVSGKPGEIHMISTTTGDVHKIAKALYHFRSVASFPGYQKPRKWQDWGFDGFFRSRNENCDWRLEYSRYGDSKILNNRSKTSSHIPESIIGTIVENVKNAMMSKFDYDKESLPYLPLTIDSSIDVRTRKKEFYTRFELSVEQKGNYIFGVKKQRIREFQRNQMGELEESESFTEVKKPILSIKDTHRFTNYQQLEFGMLQLHGVMFNDMNEYDLLKAFMTNDLVRVSPAVLKKFIVEKINSQMIIFDYFKMLMSVLTEKEIKTTSTTKSGPTTIYYTLDMSATADDFDRHEEEAMMTSIDEDDEEIEGIDFEVSNKKIPNLLSELTTRTVNLTKASSFVRATLRSRIVRIVRSAIEKMYLFPNSDSVELGTMISSILVSRLSNTIDTMISIDTLSGNIKEITKEIIEHGLLAEETWSRTIIRETATEVFKTKKVLSLDNIDDKAYEEYFINRFDMIYKNRERGSHLDSLAGSSSRGSSTAGSSSRRSSMSSSSGSVADILRSSFDNIFFREQPNDNTEPEEENIYLD